MQKAKPTLGRWTLAALVAGMAYIGAYTQELTMFYYYPMAGQWHRLPQGPELGPGITYFGWKALGALAGLLSLLVPKRWTARLPSDTVWVGALGLVTVVVFHEMHWFLR